MQPYEHRHFESPALCVLLEKYIAKKIIIINSEPDIRLYFTYTLEDSGYLARQLIYLKHLNYFMWETAHGTHIADIFVQIFTHLHMVKTIKKDYEKK